MDGRYGNYAINVHRQTDEQIDANTYARMDRHTDARMDAHSCTDRQTDRQTDKLAGRCGKMTAHMYNIWSLAYRTHSLIFLRHRYDLFCVLFTYYNPSYIYCVTVSYHSYLSKSSIRPSVQSAVMQRGYSHFA